MHRAVVEAVASCSAHGVGRVATSSSRSLRVAWLLVFVAAVLLFVNNATTLVMQLLNSELSQTYQLNGADFEFPDLYFCPTSRYSGSFPYNLNESEAMQINDEIQRVSDIFDNVTAGFPIQGCNKASVLHNSISFKILTELLGHRVRQGVINSSIKTLTLVKSATVTSFNHPTTLKCFKVQLSDVERKLLQRPTTSLQIVLMADPSFRYFNYTGHAITPVKVPSLRWSREFLDCDVEDCKDGLHENGFTMIAVPQGAYPFFTHEMKFLLSPGYSYSVQLQMSKYKYSKELHNIHCVPNHPLVTFIDPVTEEQQNFTYSYAACINNAMSNEFARIFRCQQSGRPLLWQNRRIPRCVNFTEMPGDDFRELAEQINEAKVNSIEDNSQNWCSIRLPCDFNKFNTRFSSAKWPSEVDRHTKHIHESDLLFSDVEKYPNEFPAMHQLHKIVKAMGNGSHSSHLEGIFRSFVSESLLRVSVSAQSSTSPQILIAPSYTMTSFLADTGGLLGLYIGCSVLTVCELIELFYRVITAALCRRKGGGGDGEVGGEKDAEMENFEIEKAC